jgi:hypothetical protein
MNEGICERCFPKPIGGFYCGNLGIARVASLEKWRLINPIKPRLKRPDFKLNAEGRAKARAIMNRFISEGCGRIEREIKEDRIKDRYIRLSRPVSQREMDKWKDRPLTEEMLDELVNHKHCCDLFDIIVEKLTVGSVELQEEINTINYD